MFPRTRQEWRQFVSELGAWVNLALAVILIVLLAPPVLLVIGGSIIGFWVLMGYLITRSEGRSFVTWSS